MEKALIMIMTVGVLAGGPLLLALLIKGITYLVIKQVDFKKYTIPVKVKCVEIHSMSIKQRRRLSTKHYSNTVVYDVERPTFSGYYAGKYRSFCRRKDIYQPKAEVGKEYTIYLNPKDAKYRDFREEKELKKMTIADKYTKGLVIFDAVVLLFTAMAFVVYFLLYMKLYS